MTREERLQELEERDFKGIWIPKELYFNSTLSWTEKILLIEIDSLDNKKGCFASNQYFSVFLGISTRRVSEIISKLKKMKLIEEKKFNGRNRTLVSNIKVELNKGSRQSRTKVQGRVEQKFEYNNSYNNSINNSIEECEHLKTKSYDFATTNVFQKIEKEFSSETRQFIEYFISRYNKTWNPEHPYYTEDLMLKCAEHIEDRRCELDIYMDLWKEIIEAYFDNYENRPDIDCRLAHFTHVPDDSDTDEITIFANRLT